MQLQATRTSRGQKNRRLNSYWSPEVKLLDAEMDETAQGTESSEVAESETEPGSFSAKWRDHFRVDSGGAGPLGPVPLGQTVTQTWLLDVTVRRLSEASSSWQVPWAGHFGEEKTQSFFCVCCSLLFLNYIAKPLNIFFFSAFGIFCMNNYLIQWGIFLPF